MKDMTSMLEEQERQKEDEAVFESIALSEKTIVFTKEVHGFDETIKLKLPSLKHKNKADSLYAKAYNKLLQDSDYLTTRELLTRANKRGVWGSSDEARLNDVDTLIIETKEELSKEKNKAKRNKLEDKLSEYRAEKFNLAMRLGTLTSTSVEHVAENERMFYMLLNCVFIVDKDGKESPLYKSRSDIEGLVDMAKFEAIVLEGRSFWSGEGLTDFLHLDD